jgi:hypothetical protein
MSSAIVVPLDEMQQVAGQWRTTITEMDAMMQQVSREIASIRDNAKGLNEVRSRGRNVGSKHQQVLAQGMVIQKHVLDSVQRFSQTDQELAAMVRSVQMPGEGYVEYLMRTTMIGQYQLKEVFKKAEEITKSFNDEVQKYSSYFESAVSKYRDLDKLLGGFLPDVPKDWEKKINFVKHISSELHTFVKGVSTGDLLPWWDEFTTNRASELYAIGAPMFSKFDSLYKSTRDKVLSLSNMMDGLGFKNYNVIRPVIEKLPTNLEESLKNSMKWLIMDVPVYFVEGLDRLTGHHNSYNGRSW